MTWSALPPAPRIRGMLDGIRARGLALASEGETRFDELGLALHLYRERTPLSALTSRGVGFCWVLQGHKTLHVGARTLQADAGQMLVVTRNADLRADVEGERDDPYFALSVWFDPERVARALLRLAELEAPAAATEHVESEPALTMVPSDGIVSAVERLLDAVRDPVDRMTIAPLVLDELMFRLLRSDAASAVRAGIGPPPDVVRMLEIMRFIRENHARTLTVSVLARHVAMSPSHFAHQFSRVAHLSPMKYVREVRLERARALLGEKGTRPTEVASAVGFASAAHFTREFKRRYGTPPSQYRERVTLIEPKPLAELARA